MGSLKEKPQSPRSEEIPPRERALARLNIREYSALEMKRYLRRKGASEAEAEQVVAELVGEGLIKDERYARVIARAQAMRHKGPAYIMAKLRAKGVKIDLKKTREVFDEVSSEDEATMVRQILERRYPHAHRDKKELQRAYQGLLRRGFSREAVRKCLFEGGAGPEIAAEEESGE